MMPSTQFKSFRQTVYEDITNPATWKVKIVYFFLLSGLVMPWAQFSSHQLSLGLDNRDISSFTAVSSVCSIFVPVISGIIADKIGNFRMFLTSILFALSANTMAFMVIEPISDSPHCTGNKSVYQMTPESLEMVGGSDINATYEMNATVDAIRNLQDDQSNITEFLESGVEIGPDCVTWHRTFWIYMIIRAGFIIFAAMSYILFDGAVVSMASEYKVDYGLQRAWGTLASLVSSFVGGILVDIASPEGVRKNFTLMFSTAALMFVLSGMVVSKLDIQYRQPVRKFTYQFIVLSARLAMLILLMASLMKGIFSGFAETFMYSYLVSLGASGTLLGLTVTVGAALEILLQFFSGPIIQKMGVQTVIVIGFLCFGARFVGFSYIQEPNPALGLELFDAWGNGLMETALNARMGALYPECYMVSARGLMGGLHGGVGKLISAQGGIEIIERYGFRPSWRISAVAVTIVALLYSALCLVEKFLGRKKDTEST